MFKVGKKSKSVDADRGGGRDQILTRRRSMSKLSHPLQNQLSNPQPPTVFCGVDVSAATLAVAIQQDEHAVAEIGRASCRERV